MENLALLAVNVGSSGTDISGFILVLDQRSVPTEDMSYYRGERP
jgi:hypothetical protein